MGRINQERKNDPLGSLYSELWQPRTIWRKNWNVLKISAIVQNCRAIFVSPSNIKNKFRNIFKKKFENFQKDFKKSKFSTKKKIQNFSNFFLKMFPKLFFNFFCIFGLPPQFLNYTDFFIIIAFFLHYFLAVWKNLFCPSIHQYLTIFKKYF